MAYRDKYEIRQGRITLYRRTAEGGARQSDAWYCALKIPGQKTVRRSLKTVIREDAERKAEDIWFDLNQRSERGLSLSTKRFDLVANNYIKDLETKVEQDSTLPPIDQRFKPALLRSKSLIVNKYLIPYFDGKNLQDITDQDVLGEDDDLARIVASFARLDDGDKKKVLALIEKVEDLKP